MIKVENVAINRPGQKPQMPGSILLKAISFEVASGEITSIVGRNGIGKSTLLRALSGIDRTASGCVNYGSQNVARIPRVDLAMRRAVLNQHVNAVFSINCNSLLEFGTYAVFNQLTRKQKTRICANAAERLDVARFAERPINTLSGGERQRVYLAKCLVQISAGKLLGETGQALFLDEPTTALDIAQQATLLALVRSLAKEEKISVVAVLHDLNLAAQLSDQVVLLHAKTQLAVGSPTAVFTPKLLRQAMGIEFLVQRHACMECPLLTTIHQSKSTRYADAFSPSNQNQPTIERSYTNVAKA